MNYSDILKHVSAQIPRLKEAQFISCWDCKEPALDFTEGWPPEEVRSSWEGCIVHAHGGYDCTTSGVTCLTTPMPDPGGRCWCCKDLPK